MSSRDSILGTIRDSLKEGGIASMDKGEIEARLTTHARNTVPARAQGDIEAQTALFIAEAQRVEATTGLLDSPDDVAGAVMRYLASHNLPGSVRIALFSIEPPHSSSRLFHAFERKVEIR